MPSSCAISFIVEKTTPPPTSVQDLDPATAVVAVVAVVSFKVSLSEVESRRRVLTTQIGFVAVPVAMPAMAEAQRCM